MKIYLPEYVFQETFEVKISKNLALRAMPTKCEFTSGERDSRRYISFLFSFTVCMYMLYIYAEAEGHATVRERYFLESGYFRRPNSKNISRYYMAIARPCGMGGLPFRLVFLACIWQDVARLRADDIRPKAFSR